MSTTTAEAPGRHAPAISPEPLLWGPFSGGGMAAAMLIPIHIILMCFVLPLAVKADADQTLSTFETMQLIVENPIGMVYLFGLCAGCFFHAAHRIRFVIVDFGLHGLNTPIAVICYGLATIGSAAAAVAIFPNPLNPLGTAY